ncbi:MAG: energy transducer TonB, partial [Candidatus Acidiferrales bacterium]
MRIHALALALAVLAGPSCSALEQATEQNAATEVPREAANQAEVTSAARVKSSSIKLAKRTHEVKPVYPPEAVSNRIAGRVKLEAIVAKDGTLRELCLKSGHPKLAGAAVEAVWQWKYEPTLLN